MQQLISYFGIPQLALISTTLLVSSLLLLAYFLLQRPRSGTLEWIRRVDEHFHPLQFRKLKMMDVFGAIMLACGAVVLFFSFYFFKNQWYLYKNPQEPILENADMLVRLCAGAAMLTGTSFLLFHTFSGSVTSYIAAIILPVLQEKWLDASAMMVLCILMLVIWINQPQQVELWKRGMLFVLATFSGLLATELRPSYLPLLVLIPLSFIYVQMQYWRNGRSNRVLHLQGWTCFGLLTIMGGILLVWVDICETTGRSPMDFEEFRCTLLGVTNNLVNLRLPWETTQLTDLFLCIAGLFSFIEVLHGCLFRRNSHCAVILLLLALFAVQWLVVGDYGMTMIWLLAMCWRWRLFSERNATWMSIVQLVMLTLIQFGSIFITIRFGG